MTKEKYGFIYIWRDRKYNRYYVGCHWGTVDDGYICSSNWMRQSYKNRPEDFRRRIIKTGITDRSQIYIEEKRYFDMIKPEEIKVRYYNLRLDTVTKPWHMDPQKSMSIGQKISVAKKGKSTGPCSAEKAEAISKGTKGRKFSEEHKQKLREAKLGKPLSAEHKAKVVAALEIHGKHRKPL